MKGKTLKSAFEHRLDDSKPILLDGATGTELARRGVDLSHPSWTAGIIRDDPRILKEIHRDYIDAGAEIITANTFRTHARNLESLGLSVQARDLTCRAVEIVRVAAKQNPEVFVAGSVAPLEDCYSAALTPEDSRLIDEHSAMAENLKIAGVDLILIETQVTIREAVYAAQAAQSTGLPFLVSFVCDRTGNLLSGESLLEAYQAVAAFHPQGFLVYCLPAEEVLGTLRPILGMEFSVVPRIPPGAYANTGRLMPDGTWEATSGSKSAVYAEFARHWKESGLRFIGGCCGTTPEFISAIKNNT